MKAPLIAYVTFNRLGLTAKNITALLNTSEDFELYIVDNNSNDGTWDYLQTLSDSRIKEKKRFDLNRGGIYAFNYAASHRHSNQYLITLENDVYIHSDYFISKFINTMNEFPDVGLLGGIREERFDEAKNKKRITNSSIINNNGLRYAKLNSFVGCFYCYRPELLDRIGYNNEETFLGDTEICYRINKYTKWHTGVLLPEDLFITQEQSIKCDNCLLNTTCNLNIECKSTCFSLYSKRRKTNELLPIFKAKGEQYKKDLVSGKRDVYCASIHDPESIKNHYYDQKSAQENFDFFITNSN